MTRSNRTPGVALAALAFLVACSANAGHGTVPGGSPTGDRRTGRIEASLFIPPKQHQRLRTQQYLKAQQALRGHRSIAPHYFSGATTEIDFALNTIDGVPATGADRTTYDFSIYTTDPSECSGNSTTGYNCHVTEPAPAGADTYVVQAQQCSALGSGPKASCGSLGGTLTLLSSSFVSIDVVAYQTVVAVFTLSPVVGSIDWAPVTYANTTGPTALSNSLWFVQPNGPGVPAFSANPSPGAYTCAANAGTGCYEPVLQGTSIAYGVVLEVRDPSGAVIIAASHGGPIYQTPIYIDSSGKAISISWSCQDRVLGGTSLTWETGGGPYNNNLSAPKANQSFNSPVVNPSADPDGGHTTDANGNPVTAVGNNGSEMDWDGIDQPLSGSPDSCVATTSNGLTTALKWYAGLGATPTPPTPSPSPSPTSTPTATPVPPPVIANPVVVTICPSLGPASCSPSQAPVAISQSGFTGSFSESDNCSPTIATVSVVSSTGPNAAYRVTGGSADGSCAATFHGQGGQQVVVTIDVTAPGWGIDLKRAPHQSPINHLRSYRQ